jgi:hypothetical protein
MKMIFIALGLLGFGCSHDFIRRPASLSELSVQITSDVGVIGPDGEVMLWYKDGDSIVKRKCDPLTILGANPKTAQKKCKGYESRFSIDRFREIVRQTIPGINVLSADEMETFQKGGLTDEQVQIYIQELKAIRAFIEVYGEESAPLPKRNELERIIREDLPFRSLSNSLNQRIEEIIDKIVNQKKLAIVDAVGMQCKTEDERQKNMFMYKVLKNLVPDCEFIPGTIVKYRKVPAIGTIEAVGQKTANVKWNLQGSGYGAAIPFSDLRCVLPSDMEWLNSVKLGDRVMYVINGAEGTVISVSKGKADVLWDGAHGGYGQGIAFELLQVIGSSRN